MKNPKNFFSKFLSQKFFKIQMQNTQNQPKEQLDKFNRPYPPKAGKYYIPGITTDAICIKKSSEGALELLLVTRGGETEKGKLALPGGFIEYNEDPIAGCLRELVEETAIVGKEAELFNAYGDPLRDPRRHVITLVYIVKADGYDGLKAGDDAADAKFYELEQVLKMTEKEVAFDHLDIIKDFAEKRGSSL